MDCMDVDNETLQNTTIFQDITSSPVHLSVEGNAVEPVDSFQNENGLEKYKNSVFGVNDPSLMGRNISIIQHPNFSAADENFFSVAGNTHSTLPSKNHNDRMDGNALSLECNKPEALDCIHFSNNCHQHQSEYDELINRIDHLNNDSTPVSSPLVKVNVIGTSPNKAENQSKSNRFMTVDKDFERLLEKEPSLLDPCLLQAPSSAPSKLASYGLNELLLVPKPHYLGSSTPSFPVAGGFHEKGNKTMYNAGNFAHCGINQIDRNMLKSKYVPVIQSRAINSETYLCEKEPFSSTEAEIPVELCNQNIIADLTIAPPSYNSATTHCSTYSLTNGSYRSNSNEVPSQGFSELLNDTQLNESHHSIPTHNQTDLEGFGKSKCSETSTQTQLSLNQYNEYRKQQYSSPIQSTIPQGDSSQSPIPLQHPPSYSFHQSRCGSNSTALEASRGTNRDTAISSVSSSCPPTSLKQSTMTSRTNLKQQLMREQLQDQERRRRQHMIASQLTPQQQQQSHSLPHQSNAIQVPNISSQDAPLEVPPQILQVHSKLENPTKYHVIESQKRQVLQYIHQTTGNHTVSNNRSLPTLTTSTNKINKSNVSGSMGGGTMAVTTTTALASGGTTNNVSSSAPDSPQSIAQNSSAATSVSEMDDLLEFINFDSGMDTDSVSVLDASQITALPSTVPNSMGLLDLFVTANSKSSSSCPADLPPDSTDMLQCISDCDVRAIAKDRQKKDNHNMIERRRRFNINDRIKELGTLLPKTNEQYYDIVRDVRQNKGTILRASVEFIRRLKRDAEKVKEIEERHKLLEQTNRKLLLRIQELELLVQQHGIPLSECTWQPAAADTIINTLIKQESSSYLNIKSEPKDGSLISSPLDDLMDDDISAVNGDPMLSSPIIDSPQSRESYDGTLSPDNMEYIQ